VTYNADIFRAVTACMLRERHLELMASVLADPRRSISALTRVGATAPANEVAPSPMTVDLAQSSASLHALFEQQAALAPSATALRQGSWGTSYAELDQRANRMAVALASRGAGPGRCVALIAEHGINRIAALIGILKTGARCLPLDPADPPSRLTQWLACGQVDIVVGDSALGEALAWPRTKTLCLDADTPEIVSAPAGRFSGGPNGASDIALSLAAPDPRGQPQIRHYSHRLINQKLAALRHALGLGAGECLLGTAAADTMMSIIECMLALVHGNEFVLTTRNDLGKADSLANLLSSSKAGTLFANADTLQLLFSGSDNASFAARVICSGAK